MGLLITIISVTSRFLVLIIIVDIVLHYFMSPYHPVREALDRIVEPMLSPIRQRMPSTGMVDFSPLVLIILIQILSALLIGILSSI
jgi:YggT family protein